MKDVMFLAFTFDADHDHLGDNTIFSNLLSWKGIDEGMPLVSNLLRRYEDSSGSPFKGTWFIRADNQIRTFYGDSGYLIQRFGRQWKELLEEGDELGWHPHLYRWRQNLWEQEDRPFFIVRDLEEGFNAAVRQGYSFSLSRIGGACQSNETMLTLERLGIKMDSSAMPGRIREDRKIDWLGTLEKPYHPSSKDYRRPAKGLETSLEILEVPLSMIEMKTSYDQSPLKRYVNLSFHNTLMKEGISRYIRNNNLIVTITHPFEIMPKKEFRSHPLISFSIDEMRKNVEYILSECQRIGRPYRFITLTDIIKNKQFLL